MNYYRRYIGDFVRATTGLSIAEVGALDRLLDTYYAEERPLPADLGMLCRICRATDKAEQLAVKVVAERFFPIGSDGLRHNRRADLELEKARTAIHQMADAGKRGAARRWGRDAGGDRVPHQKRAEKDGVPHTGDDGVADAGNDGVSMQPPTTNHQPPTTSLQPPTANHQPAKPLPRATRSGGAKTAAAWAAYREAYRQRYEVELPKPSAEDNTHMARFCEKVPLAEAPEIAAFYVRHNKAWYVSHHHDLKWLKADAVGLRTQWLKQSPVTETEARQADRTSAAGSQVDRLKRKAGHG
jgi:uncharacterized protein YdaU (DUF1376 family)